MKYTFLIILCGIYPVIDASEVSIHALTRAIVHKKTEEALKLIPQVDINILDSQECTPLMQALFEEDSEVFDALLADDRLDVNRTDSAEKNVLMYTVLVKKSSYLRKLAENHAINFNQIDAEGNTALMLAVLEKNSAMVEFLASRSEIDCQNEDGETALMLAVLMKNRSIIETLLRTGANAYKKDNENYNSLQVASPKIRGFMRGIIRDIKAIRRERAQDRYQTTRKKTRNRIADLRQPRLFTGKHGQ